MSATNILAVDETQYRAVPDRAAQYWDEKATANLLPLIQDPKIQWDQLEYRHPYFGLSKAGFGSHEYTPEGRKASTPLNYKTYYLESMQVIVGYDINDIAARGVTMLNQMQEAQIRQFVYDVDYAYWHGIFDENGIQLNDGFLKQATIVENLNNTDTNSTLSTKGDIWKGIKKMIDTIPFKYRQQAPMYLFVTPNVIAEASDPARIYNDKIELEKIYDSFVYNAPDGYRLFDIIVTDQIKALATDTASGDGAGAADTGGSTDDRMFLAVVDPDIIGRVESRPLSLLGQIPDGIGGVKTNWANRFAPCVFNPEAVLYSEKIVWA